MAFSATRAAFEGFRLIKARPGVILGWALFYAVALAIIIGGGVLIFGTSALAELVAGQDRHYDSLEEALPLLSALGTFLAFLFVTLTIVASIQLGAVYRAVLRPEDRGFAYMKFGADELRQIVLIILFLVIHTLIWGAIFGGLITLHAQDYIEGPGAVAAYLAGCFIACFLSIFFGIRLSLAPPMTFAKRRIHLGRAWSLTRGHFWPLLGMFVLALIFAIILSMGADLVGQAIMGAVGLASFNWHEPDAYDFASWSSPMLGALAAYGVIYVLSQALQLAVFYGPQAAAYRDLMEERNPPPASATAPVAPEPVPASDGAEGPAEHAPQHPGDDHPPEAFVTADPASGAAVQGAAAGHEPLKPGAEPDHGASHEHGEPHDGADHPPSDPHGSKP